jgi:hypothetical protein
VTACEEVAAAFAEEDDEGVGDGEDDVEGGGVEEAEVIPGEDDVTGAGEEEELWGGGGD